ALLQELESDFRTGDGGVRGRGRGGRPRRPGAGRGLPRPRPCLRGGPRCRGRAAGGGGGRRRGGHGVSTRRTAEDVITYEDIERMWEQISAPPARIRMLRGDGVLVEVMPDGELRFIRPGEDEAP